jgi:hypothetical protein
MRKDYAALLAMVLFIVGIQLGIAHGKRLQIEAHKNYLHSMYDVGYSAGWRDAQCGKGNSCEAGDE